MDGVAYHVQVRVALTTCLGTAIGTSLIPQMSSSVIEFPHASSDTETQPGHFSGTLLCLYADPLMRPSLAVYLCVQERNGRYCEGFAKGTRGSEWGPQDDWVAVTDEIVDVRGSDTSVLTRFGACFRVPEEEGDADDWLLVDRLVKKSRIDLSLLRFKLRFATKMICTILWWWDGRRRTPELGFFFSLDVAAILVRWAMQGIAGRTKVDEEGELEG
jgi:hypothetical protein